jgi:hypothetical protein
VPNFARVPIKIYSFLRFVPACLCVRMGVLDAGYEHLVTKEGSKLVWVAEIDYTKLTKEIIDQYTEKGVPLLIKNCRKSMLFFFFSCFFLSQSCALAQGGSI